MGPDQNYNWTYKSSTLNTTDCENVINSTKLYGLNTSFIDEKYICVSLDNLTLGGYWDGHYIDYVSISLIPCINGSATVCKSIEEINNKVDNEDLSFILYTNSYYIKFSDKDYDHPLQNTLNYFYMPLDSETMKYSNIFYKNGTVTQDMGIIMTMRKSQSVLGVDSSNANFNLVKNIKSDSNIAYYNIYMSRKSETFVIIYIKLQETFANIGGILSLISLVCSNISMFFNNHERNLEIENKMFDFTDFDEESKFKNLIEKKNIKKEI